MVKEIKTTKKNTLQKPKKVIQKQKQKQSQGQNVIVNVHAPVKATRKRITKPTPPAIQVPPKSPFQPLLYMPPPASFNPKPDNNASILSDILKQMNKLKPEANQLERAKPKVEEEKAQPSPVLPQVFDIPAERISIVGEVKADPIESKNTFIRPQVYEAPQQSFKFQAPLVAEPKQPSLVQTINIGQEKKITTHPDQPWSELELGGTFDFNKQQLKEVKEAKREFTYEDPAMTTLVEEARPTSEEIDMGMVPAMAQEIVQEDRVESNEPPIIELLKEPEKETFIPEPVATKANTEQIQLKALTMGEDAPYTKSFLYSAPQPALNTIPFTRDEINAMRESRVKALDKPLLLTEEGESIINPVTNRPLSAETVVTYEPDVEALRLAGLSNMELAKILEDKGITVKYNIKNGKDYPALSKTLLKEAIQKLS